MSDYETFVTLILACLVSYVFGALPFAQRLSRRKGIDIFSIGTGLAGASNVLKNVGKGSALLVLVFDIAKGSLAVIVSAMMGVEGLLILIPASLAVFGHWNSLFTRFRGGDGMAIGGGIALALFGMTGLAAFFVGGLVGLIAQKLPFSSLFSIITGYISLLFISVSSSESEFHLALGFGGICLVILLHAMLGHRKRNRAIA
tara:strand:+ start:123 stop:725 length:603 start_codon:yes stop_codon:yes gene_type:complete